MAGNPYRDRNQNFALKIEGTSGDDAVPTVAADALRAAAVTMDPNLESYTPDENTGSLDQGEDLPSGAYMAPSFRLDLRGAGTAGTAPECGPSLQVAAFEETLLAADETGTATGGDATSITLAAGASSVDDYYLGMVIEIEATPTEEFVITAYDGTTKIATITPAATGTVTTGVSYTVKACARYRPHSGLVTEIPTASAYRWRHRTDGGNSLLTRCVGLALTFGLSLPVRGPGQLTFTGRGVLPGAKTDVAYPGAATLSAVDAYTWRGARCVLDGDVIKPASFSLQYGVDAINDDDPTATYGYEVGAIPGGRRLNGSLNPQLTDAATRDVIAEWDAQTEKSFWTLWGAAAGTRASILVPRLKQLDSSEEEANGLVRDGINFRALGEDRGAIITLL